MSLHTNIALNAVILSGRPDTVPTYTPTGVWIGTGLFLVILIALTLWVVLGGRRGGPGVGRPHRWLRRRRR
ncbi:hypothetical protein AB0L63_20435 [Nocardia sp. NPDC051990]|uniref:hypothetical protein n=1 Tax=Nocardia sp. NPDC051990 TaxID=3155285 RepID=UPI00344A9F4E